MQGDELLSVGGVDLGAEEASPFYASSLISGAQQPEGQAQGQGQQGDSDLVRIKVSRRCSTSGLNVSSGRCRRFAPAWNIGLVHSLKTPQHSYGGSPAPSRHAPASNYHALARFCPPSPLPSFP